MPFKLFVRLFDFLNADGYPRKEEIHLILFGFVQAYPGLRKFVRNLQRDMTFRTVETFSIDENSLQ